MIPSLFWPQDAKKLLYTLPVARAGWGEVGRGQSVLNTLSCQEGRCEIYGFKRLCTVIIFPFHNETTFSTLTRCPKFKQFCLLYYLIAPYPYIWEKINIYTMLLSTFPCQNIWWIYLRNYGWCRRISPSNLRTQPTF